MATELLTPGEVARTFRVNPKTITRWANQGKLRTVRSVGGHRRFLKDDVLALLNGTRPQARKPLADETVSALRMRANHAAIKQVPCPQCAAPVDRSCRGPNGHIVYIPHQARRHAAAETGVYTP